MSLGRVGYHILRPVLNACDAETAHRLSLAALKFAPSCAAPKSDPALGTSLCGLNFPNPLGLAAGFDKNAEVPVAMLGLGLGFVEVGTTTPLPQAGNPRPRLFRLREDEAVINRMCFNNAGHEAMVQRLMLRKRDGIVGVNIGANKDSLDRVADYVTGVQRFGALADYLSINISSPNTPGLRGLQSRGELTELLTRVGEARNRHAKSIPLFLKIAPDLSDGELADVADCCHSAVDAVIISNTTLSRPNLASPHAGEAGGLSGRPLFDLSTQRLAMFYQLTNGKLPLIGVGGIRDAETAWTKVAAGASLLQIYTALVFRGPTLITEILNGIALRIKRGSFGTLADAVGSRAGELATTLGGAHIDQK